MSKNYKPFHFVSPYSYWGDGEVQNAQPQSFFGSMAVSILACGNNCLMPKCILARPFCLQNATRILSNNRYKAFFLLILIKIFLPQKVLNFFSIKKKKHNISQLKYKVEKRNFAGFIKYFGVKKCEN